ncbi:phage baseplate protein [Gluconobacter sphaericus]|uniref:Dit-like phage tail protein N-terminal domain-containing protein n=1 Tax=Gluconobacter sphaericus NBRC 12467 TaxID=1307951 RepID=A0AA37W9Z2_9PROT|nr:hypothetical protein [Gluconobacter sphaericus]MBF0885543.1 hypothetical protein [Gluconobacter sphaericus]GBR56508.1 hypothetical protein AA12467_2647 [Gluconobacter sphaericus NBRC 12467]GEB42781.1 hypothetical protein GSP01_15630 [Gluconobacter sphaericus NBRC 12467]GLQ84757.1 hypothetical protein GCM10007872_16650 [Gluconobacter sphaericus NBRC 12467]GLQ85088.1 hypothetical protein GCM10007872_19960 [Gluconobacter sphaericus NBRC 12467]
MVMQLVAQPVTANVIPGSGVPKLWSTVISDAEAVASVELDTLVQSALIRAQDRVWGLFDNKNNPVLTGGRVRAVDLRAQSRISDAPQEKGAFVSYNKVQMPKAIMLELLCDGSTMSYGSTSVISSLLSAAGLSTSVGTDVLARKEFLGTLDGLVADLNLYFVTTPEATYNNMNVTGYGIRRSADRGVTLIYAEIYLEEVRQTATADTTPTASPSGQSQQDGGNVQAQTATSAQLGSYNQTALV